MMVTLVVFSFRWLGLHGIFKISFNFFLSLIMSVHLSSMWHKNKILILVISHIHIFHPSLNCIDYFDVIPKS